jgi:fumarate reductase subunit D
MMPVIVALVMIVLANNLVTAFGLMAVFAIVRFRNILRDTLDTAYVLAVIVLGMACGMQKFATAVLGCAAIAAVLFAG